MTKEANLKVVPMNSQISGEELTSVLEEIQHIYDEWLEASNMAEEELLEYRIVNKFKVEKTTVNGNVVVGMTYEDKNQLRQTIGEPIILAKGSAEEMLDAIYVLLFIAKKLDSENEIAPINGSHMGGYFNKRVREFAFAENIK